jgi:cytochrome c556
MLKSLFVASALTLGLATVAFAGPADDAIKARQGCMKANGAAMGTFVPVIKGEKPFDAAANKTAADAVSAACADWAKWWGKDTMKGETLETWALPKVWEDTAGFEKAGGDYYKAFQAVAAATDDASFKAAFPALGGTCKACHESFRRPKE